MATQNVDIYILHTQFDKKLQSKIFEEMIERGHVFRTGESVYCESNFKDGNGFYIIRRICYYVNNDKKVQAAIFMEKEEF